MIFSTPLLALLLPLVAAQAAPPQPPATASPAAAEAPSRPPAAAAVAAGWERVRYGDLAGAREAFESAARTFPASAEPDMSLALLALQLEPPDLASAEPAARRALALEGGSPQIWARYAAGLREAGLLREAEATVQEGLGKFPDQPDLVHVLGTIRARQGEAGSALRLLQKAAAAAPGDARIQRDLGLALAESGFTGRAAQTLTAVRDRNPRDLEVRRALSAFYRSVGDEARAAEEEKAVRQLEWAEARAKARQQSLRDLSARIQRLEAAAGTQPAAPGGLIELWRLYERRGDMAWNLPRLEKLARAGSGPEAQAALALVLLERGDAAAADRILTQAAAEHPADPAVLAACFRAFGGKREDPRLLDVARRAVEAAPEEAAPHLHLGYALAARGDAAGAEAELRRGLAIEPANADGLLQLASLLRGLGKKDEAGALLGRAAASEPDAPRVFLAIGLAEHEDGDAAAATRDLTRAEDLGGRHPLLFRTLGDLATRRGEPLEAARYYRLSLAANPSQPDLLDRLTSPD